jgi:uncharacterized protein YceK
VETASAVFFCALSGCGAVRSSEMPSAAFVRRSAGAVHLDTETHGFPYASRF